MGDKTEVWPGTLALMVLKTLETMGPLHGYGIARRRSVSQKPSYQSSNLIRLLSIPSSCNIGGTSDTIEAGPQTKHRVSGLSINGAS